MKLKAIFFDLVGVLVQASGVSDMLAWSQNTFDEKMLWEKWFSSNAVHDFESGKCSPHSFAERMIVEFSLTVDVNTFLNSFGAWANTLFPETQSILNGLKNKYLIGSLSNTNQLHWSYINQHVEFVESFDIHLLSHKIGYTKPNKKAFEQIIVASKCDPHNIIFFDDNIVNVSVASSLGIISHHVIGASSLKNKLVELRLLNLHA